MHSEVRPFVRALTTAVLVAAFSLPPTLVAQASDHLVSPSALQQAAVDASRTRQQNLDTLREFLTSAKAEKALESAHINPQEVKKAVAGLNDEELAQFAARARKAQSDFAAGSMSNNDLLLLLVLLAVIILIIVAVR